MHHWPGPGCWLSRVTREPDTWNSGSGNFLEENSFIFCLDVYPLPKITVTSWQQRVFLCLLHTEVAKSFWTPRCICDLLHLCWQSVLSLWVSAVCFSGVADIYPHVARALSLPAQNCMFQQEFLLLLSPLSGLVLRWQCVLLPAGACPHLLRPHQGSLTCDDSEHTITSCPADSLFALTYTETDTWGPGSCGTAVPVG